MKFHNILEDVLSSKAKIKVARILTQFPSKKFTGRELARLTGLSPSRALEILKLFYIYGIVSRMRVGKTDEWSANKNSYLLERVDQILNINKEALNNAISDMKEVFLPNKSVLMMKIFGSVAKSEERPDSDVDLFILVNDKRDKKDVENVLRELNQNFVEKYGNPLSWIIYSKVELSGKKDTALMKQIEKEGILVLKR